MFGRETILNKIPAGGGGCTDIVDNYDPFGGNGVALYQLNGNALDSSPNAYNGTWGGTEAYGTGVFGQAGVFNGSNSYMTSPYTSSNTATSISLWVNPTSVGASRKYITDSSNRWIITNGYEGSSNLSVFDGASFIPTGTNLTANVWQHVCVVRNGTILTVYLDGNSIYHTTSANSSSIGSSFIFCRDVSTSTFFFSGSIDQVRIFNTALDPLEVEALYTEELCICDGTVDTLQVLGDTSCIATYQLDGNANDLSGNYSGQATNVSYGVGEFDLAGVFNGSSSFINTNYTWAFTSIYSISFWAKTSTINTRQMMTAVLAFNGADTSGRFGFGFSSSNTFEFYISNGSSLYQNTSVSSISYQDNVWHNFIVVVNGTSIKLYVDGNTTPIANLTSTVLGTTSSDSLFIGKFGAYPGVYFNGSIDQVRIFNKALNSTEVETLWLESACAKGACTGTTHTLNILGGGDTSCIAAYPLDGSPADLSGNYNGVQTDVTYPVGEFDLAAAFNGSSTKIQTTYTTNMPTFTWSAWINPNVWTVDNCIIAKGSFNSSPDNFAYFGYTGGTLQLLVRIFGGSLTKLDSSVLPTVGVWSHVVATLTGSTANIYVNGVNTGTTTSINNVINNTLPLKIGNNDLGAIFNGSIDQVRVFNKALNSTEVGILYNNETPCN